MTPDKLHLSLVTSSKKLHQIRLEQRPEICFCPVCQGFLLLRLLLLKDENVHSIYNSSFIAVAVVVVVRGQEESSTPALWEHCRCDSSNTLTEGSSMLRPAGPFVRDVSSP